MSTVVNVCFRNRGKMYYFDPAGLDLSTGTQVVLETAKGLEIGQVVAGNHEVEEDKLVLPLRSVVRIATEDDLRIAALCEKREKEAYGICKKKIEKHGLEMKLIAVECAFDGSKIIFFFSSDGRVDFRELVKDLAGEFRTRIELRQIGVRDEARMLGGLGICGRPFCCGCFMDEFQPVSTKMAKTQSMSLNPGKISGTCGRLMCCLRYEQEAYEELVKNVPKNGAFVETPDGYGNVVQVNVLRQLVRVKLDGPGEDSIKNYEADEVATVPGGRPQDGRAPAHVLELKPKKEKEPEETESEWDMPEMLPGSQSEKETSERTTPVRVKKNVRPKDRNRKPGPETGEKSGTPGPRPQKQARPNKPRNLDAPRPAGETSEEKPKTEKKPGGNYRSHRYYKGKKPMKKEGESSGNAG